jgi:hypothetical protein
VTRKSSQRVELKGAGNIKYGDIENGNSEKSGELNFKYLITGLLGTKKIP